MGFLNPLYEFLYLLVFILYKCWEAISEFKYELMHSWQSYATTAKSDATKTKQTQLKKVGSELKRLEKTPYHVASLFLDQEVDVDKVLSVIECCTLLGVSCISLYNHQGFITSCQDEIKIRLKELSATFSNGLKSKIFTVHNGFVSKHLINPDSINVFLMNSNDGKPFVATLVKQLNHSGMSNQSSLENTINQFYPRDPELMLQFGNVNTTLGYPPWLLSNTEIINVRKVSKLRIEDLSTAFHKYCCCQQRHGK